MDISIKASFDTTEIAQQASRHAQEIATKEIWKHFRSDAFGDPPGPGRIAIKERTAAIMNDPKLADKIDQIIRSKIDVAIEQACEKAVTHYANKLAFEKIQQLMRTKG